MMLPEFTWVDFLLCFILLVFGTYGVFFFKRKLQITSRFFIPFFYAKLVGLITFIGVYYFYYQGGDTFLYYRSGEMLFHQFITSPQAYFSLLFSDNHHMIAKLSGICSVCGFRGDYSAVFMIKIVSIFNIILFNSFWAISIVFCYISFIGSWFLYKGFEKIFNVVDKHQLVLVLFVPSVVFWTSGILKDTLSYSALGILFYLLVTPFKKKSLYLLFLSLCLLLFWIKSYVVLCFILAYLFYLILLLIQKEITPPQKKLLGAMAVIFLGLITVEVLHEFKWLNHAFIRLHDFHDFHSMNSANTYSLGTIQYDVIHLLSKLPQAFVTAMYRPYLWEVPNVLMWEMALESMVFFTMFIYVIGSIRIKIFDTIRKKPMVFFCLSFVLFLAFVVGLSSFNFGALSRYRVPLLPFYIASLLFLITTFKNRVKAV